MQDKGKQDDGFGPLGICHRLFNFIMNSFLTRGTRRITFDTSNAASPQVIKPDVHELLVEFRHTNGSMVNQTSNTSGQVLVQENRNPIQTCKNTVSDQGEGNDGRKKATKISTFTIVESGNLPGRKHHLLSVTSNINEKADAFIRSRKEAMEKTMSMKQTNEV